MVRVSKPGLLIPDLEFGSLAMFPVGSYMLFNSCHS